MDSETNESKNELNRILQEANPEDCRLDAIEAAFKQIVQVVQQASLSATEKARLTAAMIFATDKLRAGVEESLEKICTPADIQTYKKGCQFHGDLRHWAIRLLADSISASLSGANNYVSINIDHPTEGLLEVVIQRKGKKTPADIAAELQRKLEALEGDM